MGTYYSGSLFVDKHLAHHGIMGQKWGKRNGPPYPLNPEKHSKNENDAGWDSSLNKTNSDNGTWGNRKGLTSEQKRLIALGIAVAAGASLAYYDYKTGEVGSFVRSMRISNGQTMIKNLINLSGEDLVNQQKMQ